MLVIESMLRGEKLGHYLLGPFVIMANHVHVLAASTNSPEPIAQSAEGNDGARGQPAASTGPVSTSGKGNPTTIGFETTRSGTGSRAYIERNPVRAGIGYQNRGLSVVECHTPQLGPCAFTRV